MSITLAYPTLASPTVSVVLPDVEQLPRQRPRRRLQRQLETDAGEEIVYDFGGSVRQFSLRLYPLSAADAQAVESFFTNAIGSGGVNGRVGVWQLEDSIGTTYTVRFAQDVIEPVQRGPATYELTLTVRETS